MTEPMPDRPEFLRCKTDHLRAHADPRRDQVALLRGQHAGGPAGRASAGYDEALLVTPHGRVLEAPTSSLFWVEGETLLTPPLDDHILASITRAIVMRDHRRRRAGLPARAICSPPTRCSSPRRPVRCSGVIAVDDTARSRPRGRSTARAEASRRRPASARPWRPVKVLTVIGNRPQFIKAAAVSPRLREYHSEHAGPHRAALRRRLSAIFFAELGLPAPDEQLGVGARQRHARRRPDAGGARAGDRPGRARRGARLRRHQLDAGRRAGGRAGRDAGRPRRGGDALVRSRHAGGAQPGAVPITRARCCCALAKWRSPICAPKASPAAVSWWAT